MIVNVDNTTLPVMLTLLATLAMTSCRTMDPVPETRAETAYYTPSRLGDLQDPETGHPFEVSIAASTEQVDPNQPIEFTVDLKNVSRDPLMIPGHPTIIFHWVYPDGSRDFRMIGGSSLYASEAGRSLEPGQTIRLTATIPAIRKRSQGVIEFRALVAISSDNSRKNENPVYARVLSNGYGLGIIAL